MKHIKKFEELDYTDSERRQYQQKVDKIVDGISKSIEYQKYDKTLSDKARIKVNVNLEDSEQSDLTIRFAECMIKVYYSTSDEKTISIYKPSNGYVFSQNTVEDIYSIINKVSHYLSLSDKNLEKIHSTLRRIVSSEDHINQDVKI